MRLINCTCYTGQRLSSSETGLGFCAFPGLTPFPLEVMWGGYPDYQTETKVRDKGLKMANIGSRDVWNELRGKCAFFRVLYRMFGE